MTSLPASSPGSFRKELSGLMVLAGPLCLSHVGQQLLTVVDSAMLGRYSDAALGGAGVAAAIFFAISVFGTGLVMGLDTLVPQALGAGQPGKARSLYSAGIRLAVIVGLALTVLCVSSIYLLDLVGAEPAVRDQARNYILARAPSVVPVLIGVAARSYLQAKHLTRPIVVATVIGNLVNIPANALLIFGDRSLLAVGLPAIGLPELGAAGAGVASALVSVAMTIWVVVAAHRAQDPATPNPGAMLKIIGVGSPVGLQLTFEVGIFATASALAARLGTIPAAAHQIALTLASVSFSIALGIGASTSVRVGHAVGRGDTAGARRAGLAGGVLGTCFMGAFGIVFVVMPGILAAIFTDELGVIAAAIPLVQIAALFQLSDATQAVMAGALRGAGDNKATFLANLAGHYGVGLPLMLGLGFGLSLGAVGLWIGLAVGLSCVAVALGVRFLLVTSREIKLS